MIAKTTFTHIQTDQFLDMIPTHNFQSFQYSMCLLSIKIIHSPTSVKEAKMTPKQYLTMYNILYLYSLTSDALPSSSIDDKVLFLVLVRLTTLETEANYEYRIQIST